MTHRDVGEGVGRASREGWRCLCHTAFSQQVLGELVVAFLPCNLRLHFPEPDGRIPTKLAVPTKMR